jgi:coenzyme F420-reducing hydrogenase delta subunit/Fe-S-cluster-containing hydrogenase component 2
MCSGRVDLEFILRAFANGLDGVYIGGCRLNECNYITHGNYHALNLVLLSKKIMEHIGLNPDRLRIEFMSSGDGIRFAEKVDDFVRTVRRLGPLGDAEGMTRTEMASKLETVTRLVPYIKIVKREKLAARLENDEAHAGYFTSAEIDRLFGDVASYYIDPLKCQACMICLRRCPVEAISGGKKKIHIIDQERCIKCGACFDACPTRFGAVMKTTGEAPPPPLAEEARNIVGKPQEKHNGETLS